MPSEDSSPDERCGRCGHARYAHEDECADACVECPAGKSAIWRHAFVLAEPDPNGPHCIRENGCRHLLTQECLHGCAEAADELTRLGQEMEAQPPHRPPYAVAYATEDGSQYEVALPGDATVCAHEGALIITHTSPVKGLTQARPMEAP